MKKNVYLGVDIGSVSTNLICIDEDNKILSKVYLRSMGQPLDAVRLGLEKLKNDVAKDVEIKGVGTTGSGRQLVGILLGADVIKNEITSHAKATLTFYPETRTIFEIGGQDSKIILLKDEMVIDFAMNTVCAAGTGSFLDHQAERMKIPISEFGDMAIRSKNKVRIAGRCTVFAESDMIAKQQYGFAKNDIIKGLCEGLVRNFLNNLGRGKKLKPPFIFQGGVAANKGIKAAFESELKCDITIPEFYDVMGAVGVALIAKENYTYRNINTKFKGFRLADMQLEPTTFDCQDCPNNCEVVAVKHKEDVIAYWGDKCSKWTNSLTEIAFDDDVKQENISDSDKTESKKLID